MPKAEDGGYTVAEVIDLDNGKIRVVVEYEREGQGIQRPSFDFPKGTNVASKVNEMRQEIDHERHLNGELPRRKPKRVPHDAVGLTF